MERRLHPHLRLPYTAYCRIHVASMPVPYPRPSHARDHSARGIRLPAGPFQLLIVPNCPPPPLLAHPQSSASATASTSRAPAATVTL